MKFSSCTCEDQFDFHYAFRFVFFQLRLGSQSTYTYCRSSTFVCTGQRLVCTRVVLSSTLGPAAMKHFAIFPSDTYSRGVFVHLGYTFFQACFSSTRANNQSQLWILRSTQTLLQPIRRRIEKTSTKQKKTIASRLIRTCDTCTDTYILYVYVMVQLDYRSVAACSGYANRDSAYCCVRVHVPGKCILHIGTM